MIARSDQGERVKRAGLAKNRTASLSLMPPDTGVLTTEFKINLRAPAAGERIIVRERVVKAGRPLTLSQAEVFAITGGQEKLIAPLTATLMTVKGRDGIND